MNDKEGGDMKHKDEDSIDSGYDDLAILLNNHCDAVTGLFDVLDRFHRIREATYDLSFAKRGEIGVWINTARKYDRIDKLAKGVLSGNNPEYGVILVDALVDLSIYATKWLDVIGHLRPEDVEEWKNSQGLIDAS